MKVGLIKQILMLGFIGDDDDDDHDDDDDDDHDGFCGMVDR